MNNEHPKVAEARSAIIRAMRQNGNFTHNMIGMTLHSLSEAVSKKAANDLIEEMNITELYGIEPVEE